MERRASETAHLIVGRTGKHLFLTDSDEGQPPLLLRMVDDGDDIKFRHDFLVHPIELSLCSKHVVIHLKIKVHVLMCRSALRSFKRRVAYANANFDRILCC